MSSQTEISIVLPTIRYWVFTIFHKLSSIHIIILQSTRHFSGSKQYILHLHPGVVIPKLCFFLFLCLCIINSYPLSVWKLGVSFSKPPFLKTHSTHHLFYDDFMCLFYTFMTFSATLQDCDTMKLETVHIYLFFLSSICICFLLKGI